MGRAAVGTAYLDWAGLALIFLILGGLAHGFSRRTLRVAMLVSTIADIVVVTRVGLLDDGGHRSTFAAAFQAGADRLAQVMFFSPVLPSGPVACRPG
jgi:hypothetical protein